MSFTELNLNRFIMKTVMILGGNRGVGKEILKACLIKGYNVAFCSRKPQEAREIIESLQAEDQLYFHKVDLNTKINF